MMLKTLSTPDCCFNSLQTGKRIPSDFVFCLFFHCFRFNSLQTGKRIPRTTYKRAEYQVMGLFQFPSNGKAYPKTMGSAEALINALVSIPFKRESVSQGMIVRPHNRQFNMFQFPSNGKAYPKLWMRRCAGGMFSKVSIPFKRESVSQACRFRGRTKR